MNTVFLWCLMLNVYDFSLMFDARCLSYIFLLDVWCLVLMFLLIALMFDVWCLYQQQYFCIKPFIHKKSWCCLALSLSFCMLLQQWRDKMKILMVMGMMVDKMMIATRVGNSWYPRYPVYRGTFSQLQMLRIILNKVSWNLVNPHQILRFLIENEVSLLNHVWTYC